MAETKKTAVKKTAAKKTTKAEATVVNPNELLAEKRQDLLNYRKSLAAGELVNPRVVRATRKDIARLLTKINQGKEV